MQQTQPESLIYEHQNRQIEINYQKHSLQPSPKNNDYQSIPTKNKVPIPKLNFNSAGIETLMEMRETKSIGESDFFDHDVGLERSEVFSRRSFTSMREFASQIESKTVPTSKGCCEKEW